MNQRQLLMKRKEIYGSYHIPSCNHYMKRPKNAVYISVANSIEHEIAKLKVCYDLRKERKEFITEACRNQKDENGKIRRVDVVVLDLGEEIEIEVSPRRARRFLNDKRVTVIKLWEKGVEE